jgi:hypothetical protein
MIREQPEYVDLILESMGKGSPAIQVLIATKPKAVRAWFLGDDTTKEDATADGKDNIAQSVPSFGLNLSSPGDPSFILPHRSKGKGKENDKHRYVYQPLIKLSSHSAYQNSQIRILTLFPGKFSLATL